MDTPDSRWQKDKQTAFLKGLKPLQGDGKGADGQTFKGSGLLDVCEELNQLFITRPTRNFTMERLQNKLGERKRTGKSTSATTTISVAGKVIRTLAPHGTTTTQTSRKSISRRTGSAGRFAASSHKTTRCCTCQG